MSAAYPDYSGRPCPKCGHVRAVTASNPAWQCPQCHVAYHKVAAVSRIAATGRELAGEAVHDASVLSLVAANVFAAGIAWWARMDLRELMLVYWMQSVIIGLSFFLRMLSLQDFSTAGSKQNGRPIPETAAAKRKVAGFFALHYGFFHFIYLMFLLFDGKPAGGTPDTRWALMLCALAFLANHAYSLFHNIAADRRGRPNIGTMMFLPYARIVPMHLTIVFGGLMFGGAAFWWLFAGLKTAADVVMHVVEHHALRKAD